MTPEELAAELPRQLVGHRPVWRRSTIIEAVRTRRLPDGSVEVDVDYRDGDGPTETTDFPVTDEWGVPEPLAEWILVEIVEDLDTRGSPGPPA